MTLNFRRFLAVVPLALALTSCERVEALFKPKPPTPPKPSPYAFDLILKMSPRAEAALKQSPDGLLVDAWYYVDAAPAYRDEADKLNRIFLGDESWTYSSKSRRVHLHGAPIDTSKLSHSRDGQPQVLASVDEAGGNPDDRLSCHPYIGSIRLAQQQTPVLHCEFDAERYWDDAGADASAE